MLLVNLKYEKLSIPNNGYCDLIKDTHNYSTIQIVDKTGWDNLEIHCVFYTDNKTEKPVSVLVSGDILLIPWEMLQSGLKVHFGFIGINTENNIKAKTNIMDVRVFDGVPEDVIESTIPTQTEWESYIAQMQKCLNNAVPRINPDTGMWEVWDTKSLAYVSTNIKATGPIGPVGPKGEPGYTPIAGTDYYTDEEKSEFAEDVKSKVTEDFNDSIDSLDNRVTALENKKFSVINETLKL